MKNKNKKSRSFNEVSHYFLSSEESSLNKTEEKSFKSKDVLETVSKLEVLKNSCRGMEMQAEASGQEAAWFEGAFTIIQEAVDSLSKTIQSSEHIENNK